jgi:hypothetical protein
MTAKVLFCITRAYQAKLPAWREPMAERVYVAPANGRTFNSTPAMPNEYVSPVPQQNQMAFKGFESGFYF